MTMRKPDLTPYGGKYGRWHNTDAYEQRPSNPDHIWRRGVVFFLRKYRISIVDVYTDPIRPPVFQDADGTSYRLRSPLIGTDRASVPVAVQIISIDSAGYELPSFFHDQVCAEGGLEIEGAHLGGCWEWADMTRKDGDKLFRHMVLALGARKRIGRRCYWGVRMGAAGTWLKSRRNK